jgi:hypothetical protein
MSAVCVWHRSGALFVVELSTPKAACTPQNCLHRRGHADPNIEFLLWCCTGAGVGAANSQLIAQQFCCARKPYCLNHTAHDHTSFCIMFGFLAQGPWQYHALPFNLGVFNVAQVVVYYQETIQCQL